MPRVDVLVLGVGGMGAAAVAHLAARGASVVGVEQDDVPSLRGSSVGETRVIRKAYAEDPRYVPLLDAGPMRCGGSSKNGRARRSSSASAA